MSYKYRILTKFNESRYYDLSCRSIDDHVICDTCKLGDPVRNRNLRIYKLRESLKYLAVSYLYGTDLDYLILNG